MPTAQFPQPPNPIMSEACVWTSKGPEMVALEERSSVTRAVKGRHFYDCPSFGQQAELLLCPRKINPEWEFNA